MGMLMIDHPAVSLEIHFIHVQESFVMGNLEHRKELFIDKIIQHTRQLA